MEHSLRLVTLSVATVLVAILISSVFLLYQIGKEASTTAVGKFVQSIEHGLGPDFEQRDGSVVDGDFVRETIEEYAGQYFIRIRTPKHPESFAVFAVSSSKKSALLDIDVNSIGNYSYQGYTSANDSYYIDGAAKFYVTAIYTKKALAGVYFEQKATTTSGNVKNLRDVKLAKLKEAKVDTNAINSQINDLTKSTKQILSLTKQLDKNTVADRTRKFNKSSGTVYTASRDFNSTYSEYVRSQNLVNNDYNRLLQQIRSESWSSEIVGDITRAEVRESEQEGDTCTLEWYKALYDTRND